MSAVGQNYRRWGVAIASLMIAATAPMYAFANQSATQAGGEDPLQIVISLEEQMLRLYQGDVLLDQSRVSTGKRGHRTPRGVYSILEKRRRHRSNIYHGASMPYMQRITWSGLALHQGRVPRRPASHGCVRLPKRFARSLFGMTDIGASVVITKEPQTPRRIEHSKLFAQRAPERFSDIPSAFETPAIAAIPYAMSSADIVVAHYIALAAATRANHRADDEEGQREEWARAFDIELDAGRDVLHLKPTDEPVRVLILASAKDTQVKAAQKMLTDLGYDIGAVDGLFGRRTARAVYAFQKDQAMKASGTLDHETIEALYVATGAPRPSGHLYVRQGYKDVFDMPIDLRDPKERIGTHLYTAMSFAPTRKRGDARDVRWVVLTVDGADGAVGADPISALDRVTIPKKARDWIETMLQPGSTIIISDAGYGWETGKGTDFIVQPR